MCDTEAERAFMACGIVVIMLAFFFAVIFERFGGLELANKTKEVIAQCEASLPRNQHCVYAITARVIEGKSDEHNAN
jgi:hypothetical protein